MGLFTKIKNAVTGIQAKAVAPLTNVVQTQAKTTASTPSVIPIVTPEQLTTTLPENKGIGEGATASKTVAGNIIETITDTLTPAMQEISMDALDAFMKTDKGKQIKKNIILHYLKEFWWIVGIVGISFIWLIISIVKYIINRNN